MRVQWLGPRPDNALAFEQALDSLDDRANPIETVHAKTLPGDSARFHFRTSLSGHGYVHDGGEVARAEAFLAEPFAVTARDPEALLTAVRAHYADAWRDAVAVGE